MKVSEIMTPEPKTISIDSTIKEAALRMLRYGVHLLPVLQGDRLAGVITERDIAIKAIAEGLYPTQARVGRVMTSPAATCYADEDASEAIRLMESRSLSYALVLNRDQRTVAGILTYRDLAVHHPEGGEIVAKLIRGKYPSRTPSENAA